MQAQIGAPSRLPQQRGHIIDRVRSPGYLVPRTSLTEDPLLQPSPVPATPAVAQFGPDARRRTLGIGFALLVEGLLLLLLLTLGTREPPGADERSTTVVNLRAEEAPEAAPEEASSEPEQRAEAPRAPQLAEAEQPLAPPAAVSEPIPAMPAVMPTPTPPPPAAETVPSPIRPAPSARPAYGPPDKGGSSAFRDTERVGTAPNGEPLYAAAWYREPAREMMRSYLSTARGPGWGLIACRTAPDYRVEDCVALDEYPSGSQINRAVLAAAWEFRVRPPQRGGRPLVGSWVRIRIDYAIERR